MAIRSTDGAARSVRAIKGFREEEYDALYGYPMESIDMFAAWHI